MPGIDDWHDEDAAPNPQQQIDALRAQMEAMRAESAHQQQPASNPRTDMYAERVIEELRQTRQIMESILAAMEQR